MPRLLNPKHEEIALALSKGMTQSAAYKAAHPAVTLETAHSGSARLLKHARYGPQIRARRDELLQLESAKERQVLDLAANEPVSKTWILRQLGGVVAMARSAGNLAAMNKALELMGKEIGMFKDAAKGGRKDAAKGGRKTSLDDLSLEDLTTLLDELERDPEVVAGMAEESALNRSDDGLTH